MALLQDFFSTLAGQPSRAPTARAGGGTWTTSDPRWRALSDHQKAALMALMEADASGGRPDLDSARNALGAMINRADRDKVALGEHVSGRIYQPTFEPSQQARIDQLMKLPEFAELTEVARKRQAGETPDWVQGATHFLAPEKTMLALESREPNKYRSWRGWTGFDPETSEYRNVTMRDRSHAFLAPEGTHSATFGTPQPQPADGMDDATYRGAPQPAPSAAPITVAAAPTPSGGLLSPLFDDSPADTGTFFGALKGEQETAGTPDVQALVDEALAKRAADAGGLQAPHLEAGRPPRLDLSRLRSLMQSRGMLGTLRT